MWAKVIINPSANRWRAREKQAAVRSALRGAGLRFEIVRTECPSDVATWARAASAEGFDAVVAAGGDGTVNGVVNGLVAASDERPTLPLGIIPIGTGNDFADMCGLPRELRAAASVIAAEDIRAVDLGRVNDHVFANNAAVAMEPLVTIESMRIQRLRGNVRYVLALGKALLKLRAWRMHIEWDDGDFDGAVLLFSVCNSPRNGGQFRMAPDAKLDDGLLDFVLIPDLPRAQVLRLLPQILRGTHVRDRRVVYQRARCIRLTSGSGTPLHADGEVLSESIREVAFTVLPGKLRLLGPPIASA